MISTREFTSFSPALTRKFAGRLAKSMSAGDIILLSGPLGAGKTAFVKGLAKGLGIKETVTSPTFLIVRSYPGRASGLPGLDHIDLYRLDADGIDGLGIEEILGGGNIAAVEWAENMRPISIKVMDSFKVIKIDIGVTGQKQRSLKVRLSSRRQGLLMVIDSFIASFAHADIAEKGEISGCI